VPPEIGFASYSHRAIEGGLPRKTSPNVEPTHAGPVRIAVFSDTCGNLIQLYQPG
jgi:hypothetical protein